MKNFLLLLICLSSTVIFAQPANDNCASATTLTSGALPLCAQTTDAATVQAGEVTAAASSGAATAFNTTVWYKFVATTSSMYVEWEFVSPISGLSWCPTRAGMIVYNTATCVPAASSILAGEAAAADGSIVISLTGLTIGNTYLVQVGYNDGTGCKAPVFCMAVGDTPAPCSCGSPCTSGCGYTSTPLVATVTSTCPQYDLVPVSDGGSVNTYCYTFTAINTTVDFSMVITSNCSAGNVSALTWTLQTPSCGSNVASGTLSSLSASGLTLGQAYVLCYTYTVPATCHHSGVYPYFVGAVPLPIELLFFETTAGADHVSAEWLTATEINNSYFTLERSGNGVNWEAVGKIPSLAPEGNSTQALRYSKIDNHPYAGLSYYRLKQTDFDGAVTYSQVREVMMAQVAPELRLSIIPNPSNSGEVSFMVSGIQGEPYTIRVLDVRGNTLYSRKLFVDELSYKAEDSFMPGIYFVQVEGSGGLSTQKMVVK